MAVYNEWDEEQKRMWEEWVKSRPECVQVLCRQFPPNRLYRLKSSGSRVYELPGPNEKLGCVVKG